MPIEELLKTLPKEVLDKPADVESLGSSKVGSVTFITCLKVLTEFEFFHPKQSIYTCATHCHVNFIDVTTIPQ